MKETWKHIDGWPYWVSNLGRVKSCRKILKPQLDKRGYRYVQLREAPRRKTVKVARLVLETFKGKQPGFEVEHRNRSRSDDRLINLEWLTHADNTRNRGPFVNSSSGGVPGVSFYRKSGKWRGFAKIEGKLYHVGYFETIEEASQAVKEFRWKMIQ